jgi:hypothetical protein
MTKSNKYFLIFAILLISQNGFSQTEDVPTKREYLAYTVFYNVVPDNFNYPLIGFVNVAKGTHKSCQIGFVNTTVKDFTGVQAGFVNTTLGYFKGVQAGFVNTSAKDFIGMQLGFVNTTLKDQKGYQIGFVNTTLNDFKGYQVGFVNTVFGNEKGFQIGFVNTATRGIKGFQIGFVNYADNISGGVPLGFISIVKKDGYRSFELSSNELYPINLAFKLGVKRLYTAYQLSCNPDLSKPYSASIGLGSLLPIGKNLYFNPEIYSNKPLYFSNNNTNSTSLSLNVRYTLFSSVQFSAGAAATWLNSDKEDFMNKKSFLGIYNCKINSENRILFGLRAALSVDL